MPEYYDFSARRPAGGSMGSFSIDVSNFVNKWRVKADIVVQRVLMEIFSNLVLITPVDTGFARSMWQAGMWVDNSLKPNPLARWPYPRGLYGSFPKAEAPPAIAGMRIRDGIIGYIYNNAMYISVLEWGTNPYTATGFSPQAPRGMVRVTLANYQRYVAQACATTP